MDGESLREICADEGMPVCSTVFLWILRDKEFSEQYTRAREIQADTFADETKVIADDGRNDWMEKFARDGKSIGWEVNGEAVRRSELRFKQRTWYAGVVAPKKYGPRQEIRHADPDGKQLPVAAVNLTITREPGAV